MTILGYLRNYDDIICALIRKSFAPLYGIICGIISINGVKYCTLLNNSVNALYRFLGYHYYLFAVRLIIMSCRPVPTCIA